VCRGQVAEGIGPDRLPGSGTAVQSGVHRVGRERPARELRIPGRGSALPASAALPQRLQQIDGGMGDFGPGPLRRADATIRLDVVDAVPRRPVRQGGLGLPPPAAHRRQAAGTLAGLLGVVIRQPAGLVVPGRDVP
jgi:hypothetical protein